MRFVRRLLLVALLVGLFWVAWQFTHRNQGEIVVDLLARETAPIPLWLGLVSAFGAGALLTGTALSWQLAKKGIVTRRYRKAVSGLESEIHQLRNLPLAGDESAREPLEAASPGGRLDRSA